METASNSSRDSNREKEYQSTDSPRGSADKKGGGHTVDGGVERICLDMPDMPRGGGRCRGKWEKGRPDLENQKLAFEHLSLFLTSIVLSRLPTSRSGNLKNHRLPASRLYLQALRPRGTPRETQHPGTSGTGGFWWLWLLFWPEMQPVIR